MDQSTIPQASERRRAVGDLSRFVAAAVDAARVKQEPFFHLEFDRVFPDDIYRAMLDAMPRTTSYRRSSRKDDILPDGTVTRAKIDLFPEYIRGPAGRSSGRSGTWSARPCARARCPTRSSASLRRRWRGGSGRTTPGRALSGSDPDP